MGAVVEAFPPGTRHEEGTVGLRRPGALAVLVAALVGAALLLSSPAGAETKFTVNAVAGQMDVGYSVAVDGDTAVIGAPGLAGSGSEGAAYVFVRAAGSWSEVATLTASDPAVWSHFGSAVAVSGNRIAVGAPGWSSFAAYVFEGSGASWGETARLSGPDAYTSLGFGASVALSGGTLVVGARDVTVGGQTSAGSAYVFQESGGSWDRTATLTAASPVPMGYFGSAVAVSGDTVVVGHPGDAPAYVYQAGSAHVFRASQGTWSELAYLTAPGAASNAGLGRSVAVDGATVVVGAPGWSGGGVWEEGAAYVFQESGGSWSGPTTLTVSDHLFQGRAGTAVAVSADRIAVGAPAWGVAPGAAYVFEGSGGSWSETGKLVPSDNETAYPFGWAVAADPGALVVGAPNTNTGSWAYPGSAYAYDLSVPGGCADPGADADGDGVACEWDLVDGDTASYSGHLERLWSEGAAVLADGSLDGAFADMDLRRRTLWSWEFWGGKNVFRNADTIGPGVSKGETVFNLWVKKAVTIAPDAAYVQGLGLCATERPGTLLGFVFGFCQYEMAVVDGAVSDRYRIRTSSFAGHVIGYDGATVAGSSPDVHVQGLVEE